MHLHPLKDHVIVRPVARAEAVRHGIILPPVERESTYRGVVVAVGPTCHEVRAGDEVVFERHGSVAFVWEGETYLRFEEKDILATAHGVEHIDAVLPAITKDRERVVRT